MPGKNSKILISDDSVFMRNVLKTILQNDGFSNFVEANNGEEALKQNEAEKPELILLDLIMPKIGGIDVLKNIGKLAKVIVISAVGQDAVIAEAKTLGAKGFIIKPFDNKQVLEEVNKVLS